MTKVNIPRMKTTKHTFFCKDIDCLHLSEEESHHASRVLRLNSTDKITIIDGQGKSVIAQITEIDKKFLKYEILDTTIINRNETAIHIAIAPTKSNDRFEYFLEKVTELGINEITPILCSNSERKQIKIDRFEKIILSATKQSGNLFLPKINNLTKIGDFIANKSVNSANFIAHCETDSSKSELKNFIESEQKICILIGPEGDFTSEEINLAKENNFKPVSLGKTRLRTETAGLIACHTVKLLE